MAGVSLTKNDVVVGEQPFSQGGVSVGHPSRALLDEGPAHLLGEAVGPVPATQHPAGLDPTSETTWRVARTKRRPR